MGGLLSSITPGLILRYGVSVILFLVILYFYVRDGKRWVKEKTEMEAILKAKDKEIETLNEKFKSCSENYAQYRKKYEHDVPDTMQLMRSLIDENADHAKCHEAERNQLLQVITDTRVTLSKLISVMTSLESWVKYKVNGRSKFKVSRRK